ncbi:MAG TPA: patatin-like phospholipase family protein, partial [Ktedonobacteraceae bacterium]|nr:patatin-like phospholipase family protein [Ktedonobacteraceae bacterium]
MTEANQKQTKALVLGGGGTTGIAWEMGIILGLHDGGIDVIDAGLVVGTSAGSVVGAQITSGFPLEDLYTRQLQPLEETKEQVVQFDMNELFQVFAAGIGAPDVQTARARVGAAALVVKTIPEEERLEIIASRLPVQEWPNKQRLVITSVDAQTGEWVIFDRDAGVPLALAVSASCAVPGIYPPATIGGHRYIDGGVRSGTNADIAKGYQRVLVLRAETLEASALDAQHSTPFVAFESELVELEQA